MAKKNKDITNTGALSYRDLQEANNQDYENLSPEAQKVLSDIVGATPTISQYDPNLVTEELVSSPLAMSGSYWGESIHDNKTASDDDFNRLGDVRANNQSSFEKIANGLVKGVTLAGTTFADGTAGLLIGGLEALTSGKISKLWNNDFSNYLKEVNDFMEEVAPNYYTQDEIDNPWSHVFNANFIGDKFIKNLGFSVGALASAYVGGGILNATKLPKIIGLLTKSAKAPGLVTSTVGAFVGAVNEGRIEALNNSSDGIERYRVEYDDVYASRYNELLKEYQANAGKKLVKSGDGTFVDPASIEFETKVDALQKEKNATMTKLELDRAKMGNADLLMNIPILTMSNFLQFGKFLARGFNTATKGVSLRGELGNLFGSTTKAGTAAKFLGKGIAEGAEEMSQSAASRTAENYYAKDVSNFYKAQTDPQATQDTLDWTENAIQAIDETVNDGNAWEEGLIGFMTGLMGIPQFRSLKNSGGKWQIPVTLQGGIAEGIREYKEKHSRESEVADYINNRVNSNEFQNYWRGLIRHKKYQNDMDDATISQDKFDFKNAEYAQMVSDVVMFDAAGKLGDLVTMVETALDTTDENLESIIKNTSAKISEDKVSGPFISESGEPMTNTPEDKQKMIEIINKQKQEILNTINKYKETKDKIRERAYYGISDDELQELTWMQMTIDNFAERQKELVENTQEGIGNVIGILDQISRFNASVMSYEGQHNTGITERYKRAEENKKKADKAITNLESIKNLNGEAFIYNLAKENNNEAVEGIIKAIDGIDEFLMPVDKKAEAIENLRDIVKLGKASKIYREKYKEYLSAPKKQREEHARIIAEEEKKARTDKLSNLRNKVITAKNLKEFDVALNSETDSSIKSELLDTLEKEGDVRAKNYREIKSYKEAVIEELEDAPIDEQTKNDALKLLQDQADNAESLEDISNTESVHINNDTAFDEEENQVDNTERFTKARFEVQKAIKKVNEGNKFKERLSKPFEEPKPNGTANNTTKTTGSDNVSSVPPVKPKPSIPIAPKVTGDITIEDVFTENKEVNSITEPIEEKQTSTGKRKYYKPAIPEVQTAASKKGDFRPFNEIVGESYNTIYNYFVEKGTFEYLNRGKLTKDAEIGFMIDPVFEEKVKDEKWHTRPIVFMIDKKTSQVIGSLNSSNQSEFEGLDELIENVNKEYKTSEKKDSPFISTYTTHVAKLCSGKIVYSDTEKPLKDIDGLSDKPLFAIIQNGRLVLNIQDDNILESTIYNPADMANKEGRLYLLIPNGAEGYIPTAVRVKHFNKNEFNLENTIDASTHVGAEILAGIKALADATSEDEVAIAVSKLTSEIHLQDVHVNYFKNDVGEGITISINAKNTDGSYVMEEIEGKHRIKENKTSIYYTRLDGTAKDSNVLQDKILDILYSYNLPLQVSARKINSGNYNKRIINAGIVTSNLSKASVVDTWFMTNPLDSIGIEIKAEIPRAKFYNGTTSPAGGTNSAINGEPLNYNGTTYYVDLITKEIRDANNHLITPSNSELLIDIAWTNSVYGNTKYAYNMYDNKVVLTSGKVLDRTKMTYLEGQEAENIKSLVKGRAIQSANKERKTKNLLDIINKSQVNVDKERTDSDYYYILEEDGNYYPYDRVHSKIGSNSTLTDKQEETLKHIKATLLKQIDNPTSYDNYVRTLMSDYKVNLEEYIGKTDVKSRETIIQVIRDSFTGTQSQRALNAGSSIDSIIRQFFTLKDTTKIQKPNNIGDTAFKQLLNHLIAIKDSIDKNQETFYANNIVLYYKYPDGTRVAGEVDILAVDKDGNFKIYDVKTSKYSFHTFDKNGVATNYFDNQAPWQNMSTKDYYTLQLSAYKNIFESQFEAPIQSLAVLPFVLSYDSQDVNKVVAINKEASIPIEYNPHVAVKLDSKVSAKLQTNEDNIPIFTSEAAINEEILSPESIIENNDKIGVFDKKGKIVKSYLHVLTTVEGQTIHVAKIPVYSKGMATDSNAPSFVAKVEYYIVFPNGKSILGATTTPNNSTASILNSLENVVEKASAEKIINYCNEKTAIFDTNNKFNNPEVQNSNASLSSLAAREKAANEVDDEFEDDEDLLELRKTNEDYFQWNQEEELNWLSKVLPQLSTSDRLKIHKGLIKVGSKGITAWGKFSKGIITLSDIAAKGTTYHEAFHAVFNIMLDFEERQALYNEAKKKYGNKSNLDLEEDMAEDFRRYVENRQSPNLTIKIKNFFEDLYITIVNWNSLHPHLAAYYQMINRGKFVNNELTDDVHINNIKQKAIANGTFMKAPNGNPSNLNEKQWLQVRTRTFKEWFGDWENNPTEASKVLDENGEPLVVYHGTSDRWSIYDKNSFGKHTDKGYYGKGLYMSSIKNKAAQYGDVMPLFANIRKPLRVGIDPNITIEEATNNIKLAEKFNRTDNPSKYDGVLYSGTEGIYEEIVIPKSNQIKSATNNNGEFSLNDDDIRFRIKSSNNYSYKKLSTETQIALNKKGWTEEKFNNVSQIERDEAVRCVSFN